MANFEPTPNHQPPAEIDQPAPESIENQSHRQQQDLDNRIGQLLLRLERLRTTVEGRIANVKKLDREIRAARHELGALELEFDQLGGWGQLDDGVVDRAQRIYHCYLDQYVCPNLCRELEQAGLVVGAADLPDSYREVPVSYETFLLYGVAVLEPAHGHQHASAGSRAPCQHRRGLVHQNSLSLKVDHNDSQETSPVSISVSSPDDLRLRREQNDFSYCGLLGNWHDGIPYEDEFAAYIPPKDAGTDHPVIKQLLRAAADYMVLEWRKADQLDRLERDKQLLDDSLTGKPQANG